MYNVWISVSAIAVLFVGLDTGLSTKNSKRWQRPIDCQDVLWSGLNTSGVYTIYPRGTGGFKVYCDMTTAGGGWTGIIITNVTIFGSPLGNQRIHQLSSQGWYELRVDMSDFKTQRRYAYYRVFSVGNKASGYRLTVGEYEGNAGDSLKYHNGGSFHTKNRDINGCSNAYKGGWWYKHCHNSNLNGLYLKASHSSYADGVNWYHWHGLHYSLKTTEMKIRRQ